MSEQKTTVFTTKTPRHQEAEARPPNPAFEPIAREVDAVAKEVVDSAFHVHRELGPGLLEGVYEACLMEELSLRDIPVQRQVKVPIAYKGRRINADLRIDLLVSNAVIVEIKSVDTMLPVFEAQLMTYLKMTSHRLGILINFNVPLIKYGIRRIAL